jgi:hypothetical protein
MNEHIDSGADYVSQQVLSVKHTKHATLEVRIYLHPDLISTFSDDILNVISHMNAVL